MPTPSEAPVSAPKAKPAATVAAAAAPLKVIKAEPGQPWPEPPHAGRWSRDPASGDLSLIEEVSGEPSEEQKAKARALRQAQSARDAAATNTQE